MAITYTGQVDYGGGAAGSTVVTLSNVVPVANNLLVLVIGSGTSSPATTDWSQVVSAGWTQAEVSSPLGNPYECEAGIFYRISNGAETGINVDIGTGNVTAAILQFSGNATSSVVDATGYDNSEADVPVGQTGYAGSATSTVDGAAVALVVWKDQRFGEDGTNSFSNGFTKLIDVNPVDFGLGTSYPNPVTGWLAYTGAAARSTTVTTTDTGDENAGVIVLFKAAGGGYTLSTTPATVTVTPVAATVSAGRTISTASAAITLATQPATLVSAATVSTTPATATVTAQAASIIAGAAINAVPATVAVTAAAAAVISGTVVVTAPATVTVTPVAAAIVTPRIIAAVPAVVTLSGTPATLLTSSGIVNAVPATVTVSGTQAGISFGLVVGTNPAFVAAQTQSAQIIVPRLISTTPDSIAVTPAVATVVYSAGSVLAATPAVIAVTGARASVRLSSGLGTLHPGSWISYQRIG